MLLCCRRTCWRTLVVALSLSANFLYLGKLRSTRNRALLEIALSSKSRSCRWQTSRNWGNCALLEIALSLKSRFCQNHALVEIALSLKSRSCQNSRFPQNRALVVGKLVALKLSLSSKLRSCYRRASITCLGLVTSWK